MFLHLHKQPSSVPEPNKSFVQICTSEACLSKNQIVENEDLQIYKYLSLGLGIHFSSSIPPCSCT